MSPEIGAAIITLLGVVVTVYISFRASSKQLGLELQKVKQENKLTFTNQLLEKRMERYPLLYAIISDFQNKKRRNGLNTKNLKEFYAELQKWEVENAIFISSKMKFILFDIFKVLRTLIHKKDDKFGITYRKEIIEKLSTLELRMKSDIGVFIDEFPELEKRYIENYMELETVINKSEEAEKKENPESKEEASNDLSTDITLDQL